MVYIKPKKHFGQHFLNDPNIAARIVGALTGYGNYNRVMEVGPGTGVLTNLLLRKKEFETWVVELDRESVAHLETEFPALQGRIISGDFLKFQPEKFFDGNFAVIGNFPYNISSQILFHVLDLRERVPEVVGMFQKEVAKRIASPPGNKDYGIISVLLQAWYDIEYLFSVPPQVFIPPPKVQSAVIRLKRNAVNDLGCDHALFVKVVRTGFNQRRKTLRNALKSGNLPAVDMKNELFDKRAEALSVEEFINLTKIFQNT